MNKYDREEWESLVHYTERLVKQLWNTPLNKAINEVPELVSMLLNIAPELIVHAKNANIKSNSTSKINWYYWIWNRYPSDHWEVLFRKMLSHENIQEALPSLSELIKFFPILIKNIVEN